MHTRKWHTSHENLSGWLLQNTWGGPATTWATAVDNFHFFFKFVCQVCKDLLKQIYWQFKSWPLWHCLTKVCFYSRDFKLYGLITVCQWEYVASSVIITVGLSYTYLLYCQSKILPSNRTTQILNDASVLHFQGHFAIRDANIDCHWVSHRELGRIGKPQEFSPWT